MIDLHSHLLPGIDDGAASLEASLAMARMYVADGVEVVTCTPHILPGLYPNSGPQIRNIIDRLQHELTEAGIALQLLPGADNHIVGSFVESLRSGHLLTLADSRYVLVEPPHHVLPPRLEDLFFNLTANGYVPILTHPERLSWLSNNYSIVERLVDAGAWMQITAGSLTGNFGRSARYWSERMLAEGMVHILATDAHDTERRPPLLSEGVKCAATLIGEKEAEHLVWTRPLGVLQNVLPSQLPSPPKGLVPNDSSEARSSKAGSADDAADVGMLGRLRRLFD